MPHCATRCAGCAMLLRIGEARSRSSSPQARCGVMQQWCNIPYEQHEPVETVKAVEATKRQWKLPEHQIWNTKRPKLQAAVQPADVETLPQMLRLAEVFSRRPVQATSQRKRKWKHQMSMSRAPWLRTMMDMDVLCDACFWMMVDDLIVTDSFLLRS